MARSSASPLRRTRREKKRGGQFGDACVYTPRPVLPEPVRLQRFSGTDRYAIVSAEPGSEPGTAMIRVALGPSSQQLLGGTTYGPYPADQIAEPFELAVQKLEDEGFHRIVPGWSLLEALKSGDPRTRALAAIRLGWRKREDAVEPLLEICDAAIDANRGEACSLIEALGQIGDDRAIPLARQLAERKNLSRRRSGVEALRMLGDKEGLAAARQRGFDRLPPPVQQALQSLDESDEGAANVAKLVDSTQGVDARRWGLIADVLYEAGTPVTVAAARRILAASKIHRPHLWRYTKSVLRRAMLRRDAKTFGFLAHAVEHAAVHRKGTVATVKSGWDGQKKQVFIFSEATANYVRRACWRYLRDIARYEPHRYAAMAAEVMVHYGQHDLTPPKGMVGALGRSYLLMRVLFGGSDRFRIAWSGLRFRYRGHAQVKKPTGVREEAYPSLWDAGREAYVRVLSGAKLPDVFEFGLAGLKRHPDLLKQIKLRQLLRLLEAREELAAGTDLTTIVVAELRRRFDPTRPDFGVIDKLLQSEASKRKLVRDLVTDWLEQTASLWARDEERAFSFLRAEDVALRNRVARFYAAALQDDPETRKAIAPKVMAILRSDEASGAHGGFALLAREALLDELGEGLALDDLLKWLDEGNTSGKSVAGALLGKRPDAIAALGMERLVMMADDEVVAVRTAAHGLLRAGIEELRKDPSVLFAMAESMWDDSRKVAFTLLRDEVGLEHLGLDGLIGLCDSSDPEVEELGRELVVKHFEELDAETVLFRLAEHPSRSMRTFALGLMHVHLRDGFVPLARLEGFFRAVLFDLWPSRRLKYGTLDFLLQRGLRDERQAQLVASLLEELLRTFTKGDFDRVVFALACLQTRHPSVKTALELTQDAPEAAE